MKNLILFFALIFLSCQQKDIPLIALDTQPSLIARPSEDTVIKKQHCFVKEVFKSNERYYITVDDVDFLIGDEAVEKAKEYGDAAYDISQRGDTTYFVHNDYYVSNQNLKLSTLELAEAVEIALVDFSKKPTQSGYILVSITEFTAQIKKEPIMILTISNGIVVAMKERFTP